jgi:hypothetical protein
MRYLKTDAMGKHEILDGDDVQSAADVIKKAQAGDPEARKAAQKLFNEADADADEAMRKKKLTKQIIALDADKPTGLRRSSKEHMTPEDMSLGCHYLRPDAMGRHEILDGRRRR